MNWLREAWVRAIYGTKATPLYEAYHREKPWRDEQARRRESLASQREWEQLRATGDLTEENVLKDLSERVARNGGKPLNITRKQ